MSNCRILPAKLSECQRCYWSYSVLQVTFICRTDNVKVKNLRAYTRLEIESVVFKKRLYIVAENKSVYAEKVTNRYLIFAFAGKSSRFSAVVFPFLSIDAEKERPKVFE